LSRFHHINRSRKTRGDSRTIPLRGHKDYGEGQDDGKYFRCWNCGFTCNVERDELGDDASRDGISYEVYEALYSGGPKKDTNDYLETDAAIHGYNGANVVPLLAMASARSGHVLLQNNADGTPKTVRINWTPKVNSGCPFCGTLNWRGDY
jgi:hypothetical protein